MTVAAWLLAMPGLCLFAWTPGHGACSHRTASKPEYAWTPQHVSRASIETRSESAPRRGVLDDAAATTHRKPMLSLRLSGAFLLRFAARTSAGLLFQPPPRRTQ